MLAAVFALLAANSPLASAYTAFTAQSSHAINDGLMALFFLLIGIEIKRELTSGDLEGFDRAILPVVGAAGGVLLPALIFLFFNHGTPAARGWAIPTATDIAFSLGVLALLGSRVPPALKVFLMAVAVIDDLIAVIIIALFYAGELDCAALLAAGAVFVVLLGMNRRGVSRAGLYLLLGLPLWLFMLLSGVHATIAGVLLGVVMPLACAEKIQHRLHPWIAFGIVPLFAFANAGVPLAGITWEGFMQPLPLGIMFGLFFGKQLGIFVFSLLLVKMNVARKPQSVSWPQLYGVCMIAGIGFTMSLFIGALAFPGDMAAMTQARLGVLTGSLFSGLVGYIFLATIEPARNRA